MHKGSELIFVVVVIVILKKKPLLHITFQNLPSQHNKNNTREAEGNFSFIYKNTLSYLIAIEENSVDENKRTKNGPVRCISTFFVFC